MGILDNVSIILGKGMNAAEGKTQVFRLKAEQSQIAKNLEAAFANLGRAAFVNEDTAPAVKAAFAEQCGAIESLLNQEQAVRHQIEELQRLEASRATLAQPQQQYLCPTCNCAVTLSMPNCPRCGDNLANLKANFRMCPTCNSYFSSDYQFCENCGTRTVELPISSAMPVSRQPSESSYTPPAANTGADGFVSLGGEGALCPNCHQPVLPGSAFCGNCGARVE